MKQRIVICTGGSLGPWALNHINEEDILIGADSGARFLIEQGYWPEIAIGDFDSVSPEEMEQIRDRSHRTIECDPIDKNYTDTEMAFRLALDMKPACILLLGALGSRFDHSLSNIHLLNLALESGIEAMVIDSNNCIRLINDTTTITPSQYKQVSLLPLSLEVSGITLTGFQYPLRNATIKIGESIGISNVLLEEQGTIELKQGHLLVIQSSD
ncbi:thiamine diphosphokinase [Paenibacillus sp. GSMTC-2017]|uniref:thiamine diphosphokinase n=1 Tax=Paenibacillus sp. GSMTC-2017 TaxID=2794350 RepID=UPI0018D6B12A|nr:thiamine diphosphokinase [Paenibacillus sp. GSMTC-2017]MBH5317753.1 thiamine diphosphokinase [Paenibacillus sp. GSMTC-2017]